MESILEAEKKFEEFNFAESQLWQGYIMNLFPTPTREQYVKIKRKWY